MEINDYIKRFKEFHFFWKSDSPFSQWHPSEFVSSDGTIFDTAEQYMMYVKALTFHDDKTAIKILQTSDPREQKRLGRSVKNFDFEVWDKVKYDTVYNGNYLKFTQNPKLLIALFETDQKYLVEASPYDTVWGIGLAEDDVRIKNVSSWRGQNLLGNVLTDLREYLKNTK